jgi:hypothetical protein
MEYEFIKRDLFSNPIRYERSKFFGKEFLNSYFDSRKNILSKNTNSAYDIKKLIEYAKIVDFEKQKSIGFNTNELLKAIYFDEKFQFEEIILKLIKKFEVSRKIYTEYDSKFSNKEEKYDLINNYIILSAVCLKYFHKTARLIFLNTSLKLNDMLCSIFLELDITDKTILYELLSDEIKIIKELVSSKGI